MPDVADLIAEKPPAPPEAPEAARAKRALSARSKAALLADLRAAHTRAAAKPRRRAHFMLKLLKYRVRTYYKYHFLSFKQAEELCSYFRRWDA